MPSQMKLDDLIQERQFSHLEFFRVTIIAGVMIVPGYGTNSQNGSRSRREKGKAMLLVRPSGMIRRQ